MYGDQLTESILPIQSIFLDPNNPRFWADAAVRTTPDSKVTGTQIQARTRVEISKHGINELFYSILRNGFLPLDRIVVRPLTGQENAYVVVEGNRRLAAVIELRTRIENNSIQDEDITEGYLTSLHQDTEQLKVLVYNGTDSSDISWILQGIRHIGGIRDWRPAQQGKLVAEQIDENGLSLRAAGQKFGLSPQKVGRLYRTYNALQQMRTDEEWGAKAKNDYFTLFEEAYRNGTVRQWLEWSDDEKQFTNAENLKRFYKWICPDDEQPDLRRIHDPKHIKSLAGLINYGSNEILDHVDEGETVDNAFGRIEGLPNPANWEGIFSRITSMLSGIPAQTIQAYPIELKESLAELEKVIEALRKMADSVTS